MRLRGVRVPGLSLLGLLSLACSDPVQAPQPRAIPLVGAERAAGGASSFLVGGHLYGAFTKSTEIPAQTLVGAVDRLAARDAERFVSLGDFILGDPHLDATLAFLSALRMPFYNAPGNHDHADPARYAQRFGGSYGCLVAGPALLVLLNTEIDPWSITGAQLEFLQRCVDCALVEDRIEQVMFFAHKVVFAAAEPRYRIVFEHVNGKDGYRDGGCNFATVVRPLLSPLAASKPVLWFAGDIGTPNSLPLFWDRDPESGITFVATGLGDAPHDAVVEVVIVAGQPVRLARVPLVEGAPVELKPGVPAPARLQDWDLALWTRYFGG